MKIIKKINILLVLILTLSANIVFAAQSPSSKTLHLTGQVKLINIENGFYGIIGDDGKKYQPTNLPRKFKKDNLPIKFDVKTKDNIVSTFQWGEIVEVSNVNETSTDISIDERSAIYVLLKRIDAFNNKDLAKLQQIDTVSRALTKDQFNNWVDKYNNFTLRYVDIFSADSSTITGACYYTRELANGMTLNGNTDLTAMTFTISQTPNGWKLTQSGNLKNPILNYKTSNIEDIKQKAIEKYKTDNLASLWQ